MTTPSPSDDADRPRIPTQAELDAEDMAEIARRSKDSDHNNRYPARPVDPGAPPTALVRDARIAWYIAAAACLAWMIYGLVNLSWLENLMTTRLLPGLESVPDVEPGAEAASMADFWTPALLIGIPMFTALGYPLLVGIAKAHSRNVRSIYLALIVVTVLFTVVGADLLFGYQQVSVVVRILAWVQCGALVLSALLTLRKPVNQWLPQSMTVKPFRRSHDE